MNPSEYPAQQPSVPQDVTSNTQSAYGQYGPAPAVSGVDQNAPIDHLPPTQAPVPFGAPQGIYSPNATSQQPVMNYSRSDQAPAGPKSAKSNPNSTQNTLQIAEVRDGIVIMND